MAAQLELVLPDPQHPPAPAAELPVHREVAPAVGGELPPPERAVRAGQGRVAGAGVPEAAIDEEGRALPEMMPPGMLGTGHLLHA